MRHGTPRGAGEPFFGPPASQPPPPPEKTPETPFSGGPPTPRAELRDNVDYHSPPPPTQPGLSDDDVALVMRRRRGDQAENTRRAYARACRQWDQWLAGREIPESPLALQVYLEGRVASGWSMATVRQTVAAIASRGRREERASLMGDPGLRDYLRALARTIGGPQRQARPLTAWDAVGIDLSGSLIDRVIVHVMRDALLRVSEASALRWRDVEWTQDTALVVVRRSKTDQEARGKVLFLGPMAAEQLRHWRAETPGRREADTILHLTPGSIARRISLAAARAGLGTGYSGHSPRVGMAQDLAAAGVPMAALMEVGRWRSTVSALRYIESQEAQRSAVAYFYGVRI